uniref:AD domain-containing protein n=1 Tax=Hyaloperonospora arabidopsidis (strain Emoy2) TaxID=559515 RepID=M4BN43_HYAAE
MSSAEPASVLPMELLHDHKAVGAKVRVFTRFQEVFEGSIFTLDPVAHFLVLEEKNGAKSKTRILQLEILQKVEILSRAPAGLRLTLPRIGEAELKRAEHRNKGVAERALASIGQGVSSEAQLIFDALNKTYGGSSSFASVCANIRVMGEVRITPPYQVQNCVSANAQVLSRVKKVMEGEKSKLKKAKK